MSFFFRGKHTETAGNEIVEIIPPISGRIPALEKFVYTTAATAHKLYVMRCVGITTTSALTAANTTTIEVADNSPGMNTAGAEEQLAAGDWLVWKNSDGTYEASDINSIVNNSIVVIDAPNADLQIGTTIWCFYEVGRATQTLIDLPGSTTTTTIENVRIPAGFSNQLGVETSRTGSGEPLLILVDNITNAGTMLYCSGNHYSGNETVV